jgi:hypothetical protein
MPQERGAGRCARTLARAAGGGYNGNTPMLPSIHAPRLVFALLATVLALAAAGCSEAAVVALRLQLEPDLSGTLTASGLHVPDQPGPFESAAAGVRWEERAALACARGRFAALGELRFADLGFAASSTKTGLSYLQVTLPRGADARWASLLLPTEEQRTAVDRVVDPRRELGAPASRIVIEVDLPGPAVSHGVRPAARGATSSASGRRVSLALSAASLASGEPLVWQITW